MIGDGRLKVDPLQPGDLLGREPTALTDLSQGDLLPEQDTNRLSSRLLSSIPRSDGSHHVHGEVVQPSLPLRQQAHSRRRSLTNLPPRLLPHRLHHHATSHRELASPPP